MIHAKGNAERLPCKIYASIQRGVSRRNENGQYRTRSVPRLPAAIRGTGMVAQECTPTSLLCGTAFAPHFIHTMTALLHGSLSAPFPQHLRSVTVFPLHLRNLSALFPLHLRSLSALFPGISALLPQSFRGLWLCQLK